MNTNNIDNINELKTSIEAYKFDWDEFKKSPNAKAFAEQAFNRALKSIIRKQSKKNFDKYLCNPIISMESVFINHISCTKADIDDWFKNRDWSQVDLNEIQVKNFRKLLDIKPRDKLDKIRQIIAHIADKPSDWVADYLFASLDPENLPLEITVDMI